MYPGMMHWWSTHHRRHHDWRSHAGCGSGGWRSHREAEDWSERHAAPGEFGDFGAGAFGVRRPLRFLAYKLHLDEHQVAELARILNVLRPAACPCGSGTRAAPADRDRAARADRRAP